MRTISFTGRISGDMECFCWDDVPEKEVIAIDGFPVDGELTTRLYPDSVVKAAGCEGGKLYQFTVVAVEVPEPREV